ncbi:MAG TPA: beta-galactosidase GalA [Candidatus Limnocylindrales bacterium]|nr:beta-galactosidase GalA [Candidatus Limnocylindrales bacterium]
MDFKDIDSPGSCLILLLMKDPLVSPSARPIVRALVAVAFIMLLVTQRSAADSPRQHLSLDANWKFHLGDDWPDALSLVNSGTGSGPASERFADSYWRAVNLPHDWAVELPFDSSADGSHGFKPLGRAFPSNSIAWYRHTFELPASDSGKRIWLTFDGVMHDATVWVNGWLVRQHEGGYYPFREDISDVVHFGGENTVAVRVDATESEGWFYEGAGIYRHVWLDLTAPVAIAPDGMFVSPRFEKNIPQGSPQIAVEVYLLNTTTNATKATVNCEIISPDGKSLKKFSESEELKRESQRAVKLESKLSSPVLWSPESPKLYRLVATVSVDGKVVDQVASPFGIRTVGFDPTNGFLLNGKHYELYGTCNHQDHAGVGAAIPDALQEFRVKKLKEFGCNAIRTSHNPPTPELLDACDRLGMLVLDESRLMGSDSENMKKWDDQIRRDRNHPSVAIWCIANEQFMVQDTPQAASVARTMQDYVKQIDPLRPVSYASPEDDVFRGIDSVIEVRGWNYHYGPQMDKYHAAHPNQPNVGTEQASVVSDRGIYANDREHGYVSAYDIVWPGWTTTAESWWSFFADRPWLSGAFVWTGFDYRGEPTPYWWPCVNSHFGILDTCGFPKDVFYYYQSWWTTNTVLHLLPHWNWPGREGQEILVQAFSNCKQVELFLNGAPLGRQAMKPNSQLSWRVKYAPGTLSAKGFDASGNVIAETKVETTGDATQIQLTPDRKSINADGEDVSVFSVAALDAQNRVVPVAQNKINFSIEGPGKIIGVGNGDPGCHEPDTFIPSVPERSFVLNDWRWQLAKVPHSRSAVPEYANAFDDSTWNNLNAKTSGGEATIKTENTTAIYRAHLTLTEEDLNGAGAQICFGGADDEGWYFVNNQFVGESHDWQAQPIFDIKKFIHAGDNVIAVGVNNVAGQGGLNPNVTVRIFGHASVPPWSRSLFNGLAQIIVQSARDAGEIKLTATADGLSSATVAVQTRPCTRCPSVP